jgi:hypothetical protein
MVFYKSLSKVEKCTTFEERKIQFGVGEKSYTASTIFFNLLTVRARKFTLEAKFGGPPQRRDRAGWPKQGAREIPGPHYVGPISGHPPGWGLGGFF